MRSQLLRYWDRLRSSFWFVPSLLAAGAVALAFIAVGLDESVPDRWLQNQTWAYTGGAEGASAVLGTIAGSMITIAGVVFSLTLVALSIASSQFGPRLLRNFMRDTTNQVVLGTFVGTFLYCLLVLRTIRRDEDAAFVPHLSVTLGVLFAIASLGVLIYFIHHVSVSIQVDEIIARVGTELVEGIERLFPEQGARPAAAEPSEADIAAAFEGDGAQVGAAEDGYIQLIDLPALIAAGAEADARIRVEHRPGAYVVRGSPLVTVWPAARASDRLAERVNAAFVLGTQRIPTQDIEFSIDQLVEIAARALSPGVNDPFTAVACVNRLGSALYRLAPRPVPPPYYRDDDHHLRVAAASVTFREIAHAALSQIRQHARSSTVVTLRLLETLAVVAGATRQSDRRAVLHHHAETIARGAREGLLELEDRRAVELQYQVTSHALRAQGETL